METIFSPGTLTICETFVNIINYSFVNIINYYKVDFGYKIEKT